MAGFTLIAPGLFMALGGAAIGVACAFAYERGLASAATLAATGTAVLCWALQAWLWIQIGRDAL